MKTKREPSTVDADTVLTTEGAERAAKHWESFPQPAGWSAKWDFEELEKPPRLNGPKEQTERLDDEA